jgi:hypothetical protein
MPNPFVNSFSVSVTFNQPGLALMRLIDMYGKTVKTIEHAVVAGANTVVFDNLQTLPSGSYTVEIRNDKEVAFGKIFKIQ